MKVLLYWHDIYIPYSDYLIRAFAADTRISHLCIVGPKDFDSEAIYAGSQNTAAYSEKISFRRIETYSFRKKWGPVSQFKKCISEFKPDCIIVLDEAFSINTLNMGLANYLAKNKATVLFYSFENIVQTPPVRFLLENFSLKNIWVFIRKSIRYLLADALLQPLRSRLVHGGLACYQESMDVVHQFGWRPIVGIQWWGLDLAPFQQMTKDQKSDASSKIIGYVGRFISEKGVPDLIQLLSQLDPSYRLILVGSGPEEEGIRHLVAKLDLHDRVEFVSPKSRDELAKLYASFDVLVLPSHTDYFWKEQYGRVLVEAMACGTPVAGSLSGAIPVVIGNLGCCFPEGNITVMKSVITFIVENSVDPQVRELLMERAKLGDIKHFVNAFIDLHLQMNARKNP
ncbi:glycosyltransferase [Polynucleobacter sp. MWH-HuK1]|uniref:glycosyltransferase n=1 Tax=Polynucleobacter sp. MWH-HuK1 TaxID=1743158 RepID=UPI0021070B4F|nr:glycosyltransferase [Polynucleobacter sp. MWH-HuK1]MBU3564472.1 glycosyltransferase [Polynucleobacter sp. MWH-HuK1]